MTAEELIKTLSERSRVTIDGNELKAHPTIIRGVTKTLAELLVPNDAVRFGFEESALEPGEPRWKGKLHWILVVGTRVLQIEVEIKPRKEGKDALVVNAESYPISTVERVSVESDYHSAVGDVFIRSTHLKAKFKEGKLELNAELPDKNAESLLRLSRLL